MKAIIINSLPFGTAYSDGETIVGSYGTLVFLEYLGYPKDDEKL